MKKAITQLLVVGTIGLGIIGLASVSLAAISGTDHDFSNRGWAQGRICLPCHTPHNADVTVTDSPLWNHEVTTATFTIYSSPTLDATDVGQPAGVSKLCLSCHDGTVALDSFGGQTGNSHIGSGNSANIGTHIADDHPISFTYDAALATADGELYDPSIASSGIGGTIAGDLLFGDQMECSSCHDVHDDTNGAFLIKSNASSALCLTCHIK